MFPDARYIHWVRDPRDGLLGRHLTDDLADFGVPGDRADDAMERRAASWKYQVEIVRATPDPAHVIRVRFEDFVLRQEETLARLEAFLGFPLARIPVRPESVGRWRQQGAPAALAALRDDLLAHGTRAELHKHGLIRVEGREYRIQDGDVVHILFQA